MTDAILTHGREELGVERYERASSAGIKLAGTFVKKIKQEAEKPPFHRTEREFVRGELNSWIMYCDEMITQSVEKGDYYTAVCYKTCRINLKTVRIWHLYTGSLEWPPEH